eukprot:CFRG8485T1
MASLSKTISDDSTWKSTLSQEERTIAVQTLQNVIKRIVPSEDGSDETKTEHTLGLSWEDAIYNQADSKAHYNQLIVETVANAEVLLVTGVKEENDALATAATKGESDTVFETKEATLGELTTQAPPAVPKKKTYLRLEIADGQTFTREQSIEILKQLKMRNMLSLELCAQLHKDLITLDTKRDEMDVKDYETKMTSIVQDALKASSSH